MIETKELVKKHREKKATSKAMVLKFIGVGSQDVYNITAPFHLNGETVIAGRVEARESEKSSICLFKETQKNVWQKIEEGICLPLQDPFFTMIDQKIILGGVEVVFSDNGQARWRTVFYQLEDRASAKKIFEGPWGMKDLRLKQLANGKLLVFTRPQGKKGGRGKIGLLVLNSLSELSIEKIEEAPLLANQFGEEEWGGANEIHEINGEIWVLGHIAAFDPQGNRHYYALSFRVDRKRQALSDAKIIAERKDFAKGPAKRPDLADVVFSGGLQFVEKQVILYAGISDAGAQKIEIENPFR